jgi:hypothetical protein
MAITARQIITSALKRNGALGRGFSAAPSDLEADALIELNEIVGMWNTRGLLPPVEARTAYTLSANDGEYTVGPSGANLTGPRPTHLTGANVIANGQTQEWELEILTRQRYRAEDKTLTSTFPTKVYIELTVPNATMIVLPIPTAVVQVVLYAKTVISAFADATTSYNFPEGYDRAFSTTLSLAMCAPLGRPVTDLLQAMASNAYAAVAEKNQAADIPELACDPFVGSPGAWNGTTGEME